MPNETYRDIPSYEGRYQVSDLGNVKSLARCIESTLRCFPERIMNPRTNNNGYLFVFLYKDGKRKKWLLHRLVAITFIPNDNPIGDEVNHEDKDRSNCAVSNLSWMTHKENVAHRDTVF